MDAAWKMLHHICEETNSDFKMNENSIFKSETKPKRQLHVMFKMMLHTEENTNNKENTDEEMFVVMVTIYIRRFLKAENSPCMNEFTKHRIVFTTILIAFKYMFDCAPYNTVFVERINKKKHKGAALKRATQTANAMESEFLKLIDYNLYVHQDEYNSIKNTL